MEAGLAIGLVSCLGVLAVYFWVVRRRKHEAAEKQ
jgi:hypothetical protein